MTRKEAVLHIEIARTRKRLRLVAVAGVQFPEALTADHGVGNKVAYSFSTKKSSSQREGGGECKIG